MQNWRMTQLIFAQGNLSPFLRVPWRSSALKKITMNKWAILSGIEANLAAYEAVIADIKRQGDKVEALYILGDLVGPRPEAEKLVERVLNPRQGELEPLICKGWWEGRTVFYSAWSGADWGCS